MITAKQTACILQNAGGVTADGPVTMTPTDHAPGLIDPWFGQMICALLTHEFGVQNPPGPSVPCHGGV